MWTLVFYCKVVYKAELLELISFNEQKSDGIFSWKEFTESCMQLAQSFKEKFSVLMKATQSKLKEYAGKILLMKEFNNWEKEIW